MKRYYVLIFAILLAVIGAFFILNKDDASRMATTNVIRIGIPNDVVTFNRNNLAGAFDAYVINNLYDALFELDPETLEPKPQLVTKWSTNDDNTEWTFTIRDDVQFHNGRRFVASDVKRSFNAVAEYLRTASMPAFKELNVLSDTTFQIVLSAPDNNIPTDLTSMPAILDMDAVDAKTFDEHPVATGSFTFGSWDKGKKITLVRNETYWGKKPNVEQLEFVVIPDTNTLTLALKKGEIDAVFLESMPYDVVNALSQEKDFKVSTKTYGASIHAYVNLADAPYSDLDFRKALAYALDLDTIREKILFGYVDRAMGPAARVFPNFNTNLNPYPYNQTKARELLTGVNVPKEFSLDLNYYDSEFMHTEELAQAMKDQWGKAGIPVRLQKFEKQDYFAKFLGKQLKGVSLMPIYPLELSDIFLVRNLFISTGAINVSGYSNPKVDELVKQFVDADEKHQREISFELQQIIHDDLPALFLFDIEQGVIFNSKKIQQLDPPLITSPIDFSKI